MADIYIQSDDPTEPPTFATGDAARTLATLHHVTNPGVQQSLVAQITAAALVDIAESLRALSVLSAPPEPESARWGDYQHEGDDIDATSTPAVGDWVLPWPADADDADQLDVPSLVLTEGVSEGELWIELQHFEEDGQKLGDPVRRWTQNFHVVEVPIFYPKPDTPTVTEDTVEPIDPRDLVDGIDADFGEASPVEVPAKNKGKKSKSA